jgi:hypothetical protein
MSQLFVDNIKGRTGGAIGAPSGAVVTGVLTATSGSFSGNVSIGGTLTYEDVTNIDAVGIITARAGLHVAGIVTAKAGAAVTYYGDGSNLTGVVSGVEVKQDTVSKGTSIVSLDFAGATVTASGAGSTISISAGISTAASSPSANTIVTLNLGTAQHHDLTLTAGITTITCTGGSMGDSHSIVLTQPSSGIATVGFSTYFLFPSGATPVMSQGGSKVDLVSFVVKTQGSTGVATALLASAGLNYQ